MQDECFADPQEMRRTQLLANIALIRSAIAYHRDDEAIEDVVPDVLDDLIQQDWHVLEDDLTLLYQSVYDSMEEHQFAEDVYGRLDHLTYFAARLEFFRKEGRALGDLRMNTRIPSSLHLPSEYVDSLLAPGVVITTKGRCGATGVLWETGKPLWVWPQRSNFLPHPIESEAHPIPHTAHVGPVTPELIRAWPYAATGCAPGSVPTILRLARNQSLPISSVVVDERLYADVLLRTDAATHPEWINAVQGLQRQFRAHGLPTPAFKFNWCPRVPSAANQLLFLRPSPAYKDFLERFRECPAARIVAAYEEALARDYRVHAN